VLILLELVRMSARGQGQVHRCMQSSRQIPVPSLSLYTRSPPVERCLQRGITTRHLQRVVVSCTVCTLLSFPDTALHKLAELSQGPSFDRVWLRHASSGLAVRSPTGRLGGRLRARRSVCRMDRMLWYSCAGPRHQPRSFQAPAQRSIVNARVRKACAKHVACRDRSRTLRSVGSLPGGRSFRAVNACRR